MPRKGLRSLFSMPTHFHFLHHHHHHHSRPPSPHRTTFSESLMEENISVAEEIITKWDPGASDHARLTSLFPENREDAQSFLRTVVDLQRAMHFFIEDSPVSSATHLAHAQTLMQIAMKRLQKEFYQILSANRDSLDPASLSTRSSLTSLTSNSSDNSHRSILSELDDRRSIISELDDEDCDESRTAGDSIKEAESVPSDAMADLRSIAECMISSGYGRECVKIYKSVRRSIIDEGLYKHGFEKLTASQIHKMDWDVLELRLKSWLGATRIAVGTLFANERILCDYVFAASDSIRQSCFTEVARDPAVELLAFPELVVRDKHSPERMFRMLDLYELLTELWPDIESIFYYESTSAVRSQGLSSLLKLREAVRLMLADFEVAIQKDASKTAVPGGGLHPLTRYVINYVSFLADYSAILDDIFEDYPLPAHTPLQESFRSSLLGQAPSSSSALASSNSTPSSPSFLEEYPLSPISARIAWLILVLLCKLDAKTEIYREVTLSYLFLANNLQYIVNKVCKGKLSNLLGEEWVARHEDKARLYTGHFERLGWAKVLAAIPDNLEEVAEVGAAKERIRRFNEAFEEAYRGQAGFVVVDGRMRGEVKASIARRIIPAYRPFYERCRLLTGVGDESPVAVVRFTPDDLGKYVSDMYNGQGTSGSDSTGPGSSKRSPRPS